MPITARQQRFVDEYLKDCNATQAAIRAGYSQKSANVNGPRMLVNAGISAEVERRRTNASAAADVTLAGHLAALNALRDKAANAEQFGPAVSAEVSRGKASGFYVDRKELSGEVIVRVVRD